MGSLYIYIFFWWLEGKEDASEYWIIRKVHEHGLSEIFLVIYKSMSNPAVISVCLLTWGCREWHSASHTRYLDSYHKAKKVVQQLVTFSVRNTIKCFEISLYTVLLCVVLSMCVTISCMVLCVLLYKTFYNKYLMEVKVLFEFYII